MKNMKWLCVAVVAMLLAGCATQGEMQKIPITMPGGEKATMVVHNQSVPDWLLDASKLKHNFVVRGDVSDAQLKAVAESQRACRIYTKAALPNKLVAVLINGVVYAAAGAIGVGRGAHFLAKHIDEGAYARYGASAAGATGLAGSLIGMGSIEVATFTNCGRDVLALFPNYQVRIKR